MTKKRAVEFAEYHFNSIKVRLEHHVATVKEDDELISIP